VTVNQAPPLVVRFGALGDMVLVTMLLAQLHRRYGQPCDVLASGGWTPKLLADHPDVGHIHLLRSRRRPYWTDPQQWALVRTLRARAPGPVYIADSLMQDKLCWLLARAGIRADRLVLFDEGALGAPADWAARWAHFGALSPPAYADTPRLADDALPRAPVLQVSHAARVDLAQWRARHDLQGPVLLLQPGSKRTLKRGRLASLGDSKWWPVEHWAALAKHLLATRPEASLVLCGTPEEQPLLREIAGLVNSSRLLAAGDELPLPRLLALCEVAAGMVSIDTGPAHAASSLGCPLVVLFGAVDPTIWMPLGPPGTQIMAVGGKPEGKNRVDQINLQQVVQAVDQLQLRRCQ